MRYFHLSLLLIIFFCQSLSAYSCDSPKSDGTISELPPSDTCFYLAYDGFDYTDNAVLNGQTNGTGFAGPWLVQDNNIDIPGYQIVGNSTSLQYLDLHTDPNYVSGGSNYLASGRRLDTETGGAFNNYISTSTDAIGASANGEVLYVSFLFQKENNDNASAYIDLHGDNLAWCNLCQSTNRLGIGYFGTDSNVNGERRWSLNINGSVIPSSEEIIAGTPTFIVAKITFNPSNTDIELFINPPSLGDNEPASPTLSYQSSQAHLIRSITYYGGAASGFSSIDEIRFAESYTCVCPDASVFVYEPPIASASADITSGTAPLTVQFDGTGSSNPSGGSLNYLWDFGDGSPTSTDSIVTHTYVNGGVQYNAMLTVSNEIGLSHSEIIPISVFNPDGSFPCLSSITALQKADCSGSGGSFRINIPGNTNYQLEYQGNTLPIEPNNTYTNLDTGIYHLTINGSSGCTEDYDLYVEIDSSTCSEWEPASCAMEIGTNLTGFADWEPHRAMRNFLKGARGQAIPYSDACGCWSFSDSINQIIFDEMSFDTNGYATSLPQSTSQGDIMLRYFVSSSGANMPANQTYVLLYDGVGTFAPSGTLSNLTSTPGRIQFDLGGDGTFWFQLTSSQLGNHVRNIRVVRLADEFTDLDTYPFYSEFLNKIEPFSNLRFMDWQQTNNNPLVRWEERTKLGQFSYAGANGAPYELLIQLANMTGKDIWICVPHMANDDFINQMAQLFLDELDPEITIYLEYSNEVWNWIFEQAHYNVETNPQNYMYGRAMAAKAKNVFDIWHTVFAGEECRVKRVLGLQAGFNYLNEQILAHLPQDSWDYGSPTHYFGLDHGETGNPRLDLLGSSATVVDVMMNAQNNWASFKELVKQDYRNVQLYGKEVITYEGGQHFVGNVFGIPYDYQQAMWDAQLSSEMYDMYDAVHDSLRTWGCRLASNFSLAGEQESIYGSWGVMTDIDIQGPYMTTAPKYQALIDNMPPENCKNINVWTGEKSNSWSNSCNWGKSRVPNASTEVIIPGNAINQPVVDENAFALQVRLSLNAVLTILNGYTLELKE